MLRLMIDRQRLICCFYWLIDFVVWFLKCRSGFFSVYSRRGKKAEHIHIEHSDSSQLIDYQKSINLKAGN